MLGAQKYYWPHCRGEVTEVGCNQLRDLWSLEQVASVKCRPALVWEDGQEGEAGLRWRTGESGLTRMAGRVLLTPPHVSQIHTSRKCHCRRENAACKSQLPPSLASAYHTPTRYGRPKILNPDLVIKAKLRGQ